MSLIPVTRDRYTILAVLDVRRRQACERGDMAEIERLSDLCIRMGMQLRLTRIANRHPKR